MKPTQLRACLWELGSVVLLWGVANAAATVLYVDVSNPAPVVPYANWAAAAASIQDAVDAANDGDQILVTNGVYQTGGRAVYGMNNRVAVTKAVKVQSVNGPAVTSIRGFQVPDTINGPSAVRCAYLTNGAVLSGFTLCGGATRSDGDLYQVQSGGGVLCESGSAIVTNCILTGNVSAHQGGGAYQGTLNNCLVSSNSAPSGGGVGAGTVNNSTLTGNTAGTGGGAIVSTFHNCVLMGNGADYGGGVEAGALYNCTVVFNSASVSGGGAHGWSASLFNSIVYYNAAPDGNFDPSSSLVSCCTTPLPTFGRYNVADEPQLASFSHLSAASPCRGLGSSVYSSGVDIDGEPWGAPPAIGCDQYWSGSCTGALTAEMSVDYTNLAVGGSGNFLAFITGRIGASSWEFGDGTVVSNRPCASHSWAMPGDYPVVLRAYNESYPAGVAATVTVHVVAQPIHYVALDSVSPVAPYSSWATAATNIQDAVDTAVPGALVLVSNGVYQTGGRAVYGVSNRVVVSKAVVVRSLKGPGVTSIAGSPGFGASAVRCVYLASGAVLSGFTLTNGATQAAYDDYRMGCGGGVWCESGNAVVTDCTLTGNSAYYGGGAYQGTLNNCILAANWASYGGGASYRATLNSCTLTGNVCNAFSSGRGGGGANGGTLNHCTLTGNSSYYGGGANQATLNNCTLTGNSASYGGGAAYLGTLNNCVLTGNSADYYGGGAYQGTLNNCTLTRNTAYFSGGGACSATLRSCIVWYNLAPDGNYDSSSSLNYCCTTPLPSASVGNLSAEPQLANSSHLSATSPCRGRGWLTAGVDIDGEPWASSPSIGCDEYWSGSLTGALSADISVEYTNVAVGFSASFQALVTGETGASSWDFGDGTVVSNRPYASHGWVAPGDYPVVLQAYNATYPAGIAATVTVHVVTQPVHYVALNSVSPAAPYSSWATAATNIQDAVDAATVGGALVWVSNGVYQTGARSVDWVNCRLAVTKAVVVQSVNGPGVTSINGGHSLRCAYLTNEAVLSGFTVTGGTTWGGDMRQDSGGGVWCESVSTLVTNCTLTDNYSWNGGASSGTLNYCLLTGNSGRLCGAAHYAVLNYCTLTNNSAEVGGAAYGGTLNYCTLAGNIVSGEGGAAYGATLNYCILTGNSSSWYGGGAYNGTLNFCTLTGNSATNGGGVYGATLNNCVLSGNTAVSGGGAYSATLRNCAVTDNAAATTGGGAASSTLYNCTVAGNVAGSGSGGVSASTARNCIIYYNTAPDGNYDSASNLGNCCSTPQSFSGMNNISAEPQLVSAYHVSPTSPCRRAGTDGYASGVDIDCEPWPNSYPSIGCDECWSGSLTGALSAGISVDYTTLPVGAVAHFETLLGGAVATSGWDFGDGTVVSNRAYASHSWAAAGYYQVVLRAYNATCPSGVAAAVGVHVVDTSVHYVTPGSVAPVAPYSSWATAATNIQDAVDAARDGDYIIVTNGVYQTGARAVYGMSNRVAVTKAAVVQSVHGPEVTRIVGYRLPGSMVGASAVRCAYLTNGAVLSGFTLTNGATQVGGDAERQQYGGGVWCESLSGIITNCVLTGNAGYYNGGGAYRGTLTQCTLTNNSAAYGGGACSGTLLNCAVRGNSAIYGGGVYEGTLANCLVTRNSAFYGGGVYASELNNCTMSGNLAYYEGGGTAYGRLANCIVYDNRGAGGASSNYDQSAMSFCCTAPLPSGLGNFTNAPLWVNPAAGNLRLQSNSPCINAGWNPAARGLTDLDGNPRIAGGAVDLGAYELAAPASGISYAWLQANALATDGSADEADTDGDGLSNRQEWVAGTDPNDAASTLRMLTPSLSDGGLLLSWTSVTNRTYFLQWATNMAAPPGWFLLQSNLAGQAGVTTFAHPHVPGTGPVFYRVGVQQ